MADKDDKAPKGYKRLLNTCLVRYKIHNKDPKRTHSVGLRVLMDTCIGLNDGVPTDDRGGGMGLISGRKAFQRPMNEGVELLNAIQDVYLSNEITVA